ncbi:uncharacterized protein [Clytia hemisphaerica]|uniref:uncharacterized protein n=1 Tax=Clytia hemisphaerica TaxID=252671 RepID=UPI0034D4A649
MKDNAKRFAQENGVTDKELSDHELEQELKKFEKDDSPEGQALRRDMKEILHGDDAPTSTISTEEQNSKNDSQETSTFLAKRKRNIKEMEDFQKSIGLPTIRPKLTKSVNVEQQFAYLSEDDENEDEDGEDRNEDYERSSKPAVHFCVDEPTEKTVESIDETNKDEATDVVDPNAKGIPLKYQPYFCLLNTSCEIR